VGPRVAEHFGAKDNREESDNLEEARAGIAAIFDELKLDVGVRSCVRT
jgi:hypothetical protein